MFDVDDIVHVRVDDDDDDDDVDDDDDDDDGDEEEEGEEEVISKSTHMSYTKLLQHVASNYIKDD